MQVHPLIRRLQKIVGDDYVVHLPDDLVVYEHDGSIEEGVPSLVVLPNSTADVAAIMKIAAFEGLPVVARGAGTGLSGGAVASQGGILLSMTRMNRILDVDLVNRTAVVEPGVVNIDLSHEVAPYGLTYVPDPSSQKACTIGGNVAENAGGPHCLAYGVTTNHVLGLEVVLSDGSTHWLGGRLRDTPGYDLVGLVVGSEGTLAIVTKIIVRLSPIPEVVKTFLAVYADVEAASLAVSSIVGRGIIPAALEMMDHVTIQAVEPAIHAGYPMDAGAVLLVELDSMAEKVEGEASEVEEVLKNCGAIEVRTAEDPNERERLWSGRKGALGALGRLAPNYYLLDGVVPRTRLPEALRHIHRICSSRGLTVANVFHAGDGNLHPCILFDERNLEHTQAAMEAGGEILKMCIELGGVLSGEHGVGLEKQAYMPLMFSPEDLEIMQTLTTAFDPLGLLNPGKIFPTGQKSTGFGQQAAVRRTGPGAYI